MAQAEGDAPAAIRYAHEGLNRLRTTANPSAATEGAILGAIADAERFGGHIAAAEDYFRQSLQQFARSGRDIQDTLPKPELSLIDPQPGRLP